jgi:HlyD family secretion protein
MRLSKMQMTAGAAAAILLIAVPLLMRPKPIEVDASAVTIGPLDATVDADGKTRVRDRYLVVAPVGGRVERIAFVEGGLVRAGQIVATLRAMPLDSSAVAQVRARIEAADALVIQAAAQSRVAGAELDQKRRDLQRAQRLAEAGGVAPRVVEESQLAQLQAEETLRSANERTRAAEADARQARAILVGQTGGVGTTVLVRAPAAGRVLRVPERSERVVAAGTPLIELGDPRSLEIVVDVLSSDGALIHPGDRVRLGEWTSGDAEHEELGGHVREIEPSGFTKISALGVEEQRVNVIIDPDTVPASIGDGFRVEASIVVWSAPSVTSVPRSALLQFAPTVERAAGGGGGASWRAFVVRDGRLETRTVRVGHVGGAQAEVVAGLAAGDTVVVFPSDQVRSGLRVRLRKG